MDIKNLKRANELGKELEELKLCRDLLLGGGDVKVVGNSEDTFGVIRDRDTKEAILCSVKERIKAAKEEVKTL